MSDHQHGMRLRQVASVATNHSQIRFSRRKSLGGFKGGAGIGYVEPDGRLDRSAPGGNGRHRLGGLTVNRADRDRERCGARIIAIAEETYAGHHDDNTGKEDYATPQRQSY